MTDLATRTASAWPTASDNWGDAGTIERYSAAPQSQGERMREWLHLFKECREAAEILARTSFVPKDMMGKPAEIATAMLKGWELGLDPLDALASIYVVHGRVGFYAEFMRRRMIQAGHVFRVVESTDSRCVVEGTRVDNGETHRAVFTAEQAKRAKIDIQAYPAEKLVARATSRLVKQAFPDELSGSLIVEDLLDGVIAVDSERPDEPVPQPADGAIQRRRQPRKVTASRVERPKPTPAVDVDDLLDEPEPAAPQPDQPAEAAPVDEGQGDLLDDEPAATPAESDPAITRAQLQKLSILRQKEGHADDEQGRASWFQWVEVNIGRRVESNKDLTKAEASVLIDVIEGGAGQ